MKALSLRQPWAHAVVHMGKNVENRVWTTSFRGRFLVHAAKGCTPAYFDDALRFMVGRSLATFLGQDNAVVPRGRPTVPRYADVPRGAIVGAATLVGVIPREDLGLAWKMPLQYGFMLEDVVAYAEPIPCMGMLKFFTPSAEVRAAVLQADCTWGAK